jgi:hypothetical protein
MRVRDFFRGGAATGGSAVMVAVGDSGDVIMGLPVGIQILLLFRKERGV